MLAFLTSKFKCYSQTEYDNEVLNLLQFIFQIPCPKCRLCTLICYGFYTRRIHVPNSDEFIWIRVQRLFCKSCHTSHVVLPDHWIPRSPVCLEEAVSISKLQHKQFSRYQNNNYCLTDKYLYSVRNRVLNWINIYKPSYALEEFSLLIKNLFCFTLYQHTRDTFSLFSVL